MAKSRPRQIVPDDVIEELRNEEHDKEPAGSLQPIGEQKGWAGSLNADALSRAHTIREKIDSEIDKAVKSQVNSKLAIGRLLNEGRDLFPGDNEFGKWRKEHWPDLAPTTLNTMQRMAVEFKNSTQFLESVGWSVGRELIGAAPVVWKQVEKKLADTGEPPTVKEVQEAKKASAPSGSSGTQTGRMSGDDGAAQEHAPPMPAQRKTGKVVSLEDRANNLRNGDHKDRVLWYKNWDLPAPLGEYALFGLLMPEPGESYPDWLLAAVYAEVEDNMEPEHYDLIQSAYDDILEDNS